MSDNWAREREIGLLCALEQAKQIPDFSEIAKSASISFETSECGSDDDLAVVKFTANGIEHRTFLGRTGHARRADYHERSSEVAFEISSVISAMRIEAGIEEV